MRASWTLALLVAGCLCGLSQLLPADEFSITPDVVYGHKAGMALTYDVVRPAQQNGAGVLFMVSGGWVSKWAPPQALVRQDHPQPNQFESLVDKGYTLFIVRHGSSPQFKVPEAVGDVRRAVRFIRMHAQDYGIDPDRLGVFGGSAGGHLSLMLGTASDEGQTAAPDPVDRVSDRVAAVVAIYPPTKIDEFFPLKDRFPALDFDPKLADSISPLLHVSADDPPTLLIHGNKDELVPISNSERIEAAFKQQNVPVELIVIDGAGHGFSAPDQARTWQAMLEWFDKYLPAKK